MFIIYDMYIPSQGARNICWLVSAAMITYHNPTPDKFIQTLESKEQLLQSSGEDVKKLRLEGLNPKGYTTIYKKLGLESFTMAERAAELSTGIHRCLQEYGPFIRLVTGICG